VESPIRNQPAVVTPALVSGTLSTFPTITPATPQVRVTIDDDGPYVATLASAPATLASARDLLQNAIRQAHNSPAFTQARVINAANRLIVLPGIPSEVTINVATGDATANLLRLTPGASQLVIALVSGGLSPFPTLTAAMPSVT